jgi:hypothetical protein
MKFGESISFSFSPWQTLLQQIYLPFEATPENACSLILMATLTSLGEIKRK